LLTKKNKTYN